MSGLALSRTEREKERERERGGKERERERERWERQIACSIQPIPHHLLYTIQTMSCVYKHVSTTQIKQKNPRIHFTSLCLPPTFPSTSPPPPSLALHLVHDIHVKPADEFNLCPHDSDGQRSCTTLPHTCGKQVKYSSTPRSWR